MSTHKIEKHLTDRGFTIEHIGNEGPKDPALDALALLLSFQFPTFQNLLRHIRGDMRKKPGFFLRLAGLSENEVLMVKNTCLMLYRNGLLSKYEFKSLDTTIHGEVAQSERAMSFLSGGWLETCIRIHVESFLNLAPQHIEFAQNVHVRRPARHDGTVKSFEMDALLAVDGTLYWWEAKSGQYTPEHTNRYANVADEIGLPHKQCFLILGEPHTDSIMGLTHLEKDIGFRIIQPQHIPGVVEEIETRHRAGSFKH
jgi:hypothetical protein